MGDDRARFCLAGVGVECACMYVICACMYVCIQVRTYECMYVCVCIYIYACMYYMHICVHKKNPSEQRTP